MTTLPLAEARARLSELVAAAQTTHERFEITRNGRPAAVLVATDDYEAMRETIAVLADGELMQAVTEGLAQLHTGDVLNEDELAGYLRRHGRGG
ncbi:type II toxin-antitoxin system Phd/YefM family antitoxin [Protofrankia coriariae]|uniref:Antitoxin n=1 Tax=Protofrankia coriariae TaxID=1562887 RepID=A0ABR5F046_9ACTN|nr:type II toxin-antitoxin system Phd/YefM family antitoxin [Protofrankia coriariae]KLL10025.1 prevent-host-death protein [Protofrankia coriariae]